jgi:hypothetical protein
MGVLCVPDYGGGDIDTKFFIDLSPQLIQIGAMVAINTAFQKLEVLRVSEPAIIISSELS